MMNHNLLFEDMMNHNLLFGDQPLQLIKNWGAPYCDSDSHDSDSQYNMLTKSHLPESA